MKIKITVDNFAELDSFAASWLARNVTISPDVAEEAAPLATDPQPVPAPQPVPEPDPMPAPAPAAPAATIDDVTRAAVALMDQGRKADLMGLLGKFGVRSLTELRPEQLGPFLQALQAMGGAQ